MKPSRVANFVEWGDTTKKVQGSINSFKLIVGMHNRTSQQTSGDREIHISAKKASQRDRCFLFHWGVGDKVTDAQNYVGSGLEADNNNFMFSTTLHEESIEDSCHILAI